MKEKNLFIILLLLMTSNLVNAEISVEIYQSDRDPGSVIAGKTFTVTASGWSGSCNSAVIDLTECSVCNISESTSKSISGSSVSWTTLTATPTDTTQEITVSVSGTCTPDSGSVSFDAKTAPSLYASVSPSSISVTQGSTFSLSLNIQNNGETTARFGSITVSPSDFTISSGCSPSDIPGGQNSGISCTITANGQAGTKTLSILISPTNADPVTKTISVMVNPVSATTTTAVGKISGVGPGTAFALEKKKSKTWTEMIPGVAETMHVDDPEIGLKMINITLKNPATLVTITVKKLEDKPSSVIHEVSGKIYKYIEIETSNLADENISKVDIQFPVNKTWIVDNDIDSNTVALNRYTTTWKKLPTVKIDEDSDYLYYEAEAPGLSIFAVTGEPKTTTTITTETTTTTTTITTETTTSSIPTPEETTTTLPPTQERFPIQYLLIGILILLLISVGFWFYSGKVYHSEFDRT